MHITQTPAASAPYAVSACEAPPVLSDAVPCVRVCEALRRCCACQRCWRRLHSQLHNLARAVLCCVVSEDKEMETKVMAFSSHDGFQ